jgi:hypothetical protein
MRSFAMLYVLSTILGCRIQAKFTHIAYMEYNRVIVVLGPIFGQLGQ